MNAEQVSADCLTGAPGVGLQQSLGLFDSTMIVAGSMIGTGSFIVAAEMARTVGSSGWLLASWIITGLLTVAAALSYGELAAMMPLAGGQYVYLREAWSPLCGFLYGWTLFMVIQTGTVAAVGVGFARYLGILWPRIAENAYIIPPLHVFSGYAISLSTGQLVGVAIVALLSWSNARGINYGRLIQNTFTSAKLASLLGVTAVGIVGWNSAGKSNFASLWRPQGYTPIAPGLTPETLFGLIAAICLAQAGSLFAADAWNNITFTAGEVKNPRRNLPLSLVLGVSIVTTLFFCVNLAYVGVLPLDKIQHAPFDRVAGAMLQAVLPSAGAALMAIVIVISAFGCINGMLMSGARAYFAMARDGLFFRHAAQLNRARVPGSSLAMQGAWACFLILIRTYNPSTKTFGNLFSSLLEYVVSAALVFYILTILGVFRLRRLRPDAVRPYRAWGYPVVPALYLIGAASILAALFLYRPATTFPGLAIILIGVPVYFVFRRSKAASTALGASETSKVEL
jgi:APA family basic amino acid/polyamine antiporter